MLSRRMLAPRSSVAAPLAFLFCAALAGAQTPPNPAPTPPAPAPPAAQTPPPPGTAEPSAPAALPPAPAGVAQAPVSGEQGLQLTLEQALKIAADNDLGLRIEEVSTEIAGYEYAGSWGTFDPRVTARAAVTNTEFEASSSLSGANVVREDTQEFSTGLRFPLTTGGEFTADYSRVN